ncbi:YbaK/EbsC family protein [Anaerostipes sp.]|uniref:YbaK/EbsC family protein n=1 Tax=Anaerostipes sp. TaxID=1872530 RepID=UPI0025BC1AFF|nr:YbaK/EbsC family protein [Anaerostipes sp.]MBS7009312.1 YbaK/EbsC family protein [Anaerostipes sp.]
MSVAEVKNYLESYGMAERAKELEVSSATVELAAKALGVEEARIAKTLSFYGKDHGCILVVTAGDAKIDNKKFKGVFGLKAKMLQGDDVKLLTGHERGGVCPFANPEGTRVFLDESLLRFQTVFPACGSANSAIELQPEELFLCSQAEAWVDVTKTMGEQG